MPCLYICTLEHSRTCLPYLFLHHIIHHLLNPNMPSTSALVTLTLLLSALPLALTHAGHDQAPLSADPDTDWATRHMSEEHHINNFDAGSFFNLHDYDSSGTWSSADIQRTYGLRDPSTAHLSKEAKDAVSARVLEIFDKDLSGTVSYPEFLVGSAHGLKLPDFGYGPGHHGDDEYEYEIHHFEKYHDENTKEEDLVHPEDIAHFRHHDELEEQAERQRVLDRMPVVEANIPAKFRRHG